MIPFQRLPTHSFFSADMHFILLVTLSLCDEKKIGVSSSELDRMLQLTCPISAGYEDDAFDDDDQD